MLLIDNKFRYRSKAQFAYGVIRSAIVSGSLKPGTRLVLTHFAEELGISEIPVREAVKQLEAEGLISKSGTTFMVTKLSKQELEENYIIRSALEVAATRAAVEYIDDGALAELEEIHLQMTEFLKKNEYVEYGELNQQFHLMIYAQCPYGTLYNMIKDLWEHAQRTRAIFALRSQTSLDSQKEHLELLQALKEKNIAQAEAIMRRHTDRTLSVIKSLIEDEVAEN